MLELEFEPEPIQDKAYFTDMPMEEYRANNALANSDMQQFKITPSNHMWNLNAPHDEKNANYADFGTVFHTALLEPELLQSTIHVSSLKGRTSQEFHKEQTKFKGKKIVITQSEYDQIMLMEESANANPMYRKALVAKGDCEVSIFVKDPITGLSLKIRVDKLIHGKKPVLADVKTTANLEDWRNDRQFINPLFKIGYGFTAAFYLYVASIYFEVELDQYFFLVSQKSATLGRYPASVFSISKAELIEYGFWAEMLETLQKFKECAEANKWVSFESFPQFQFFDDGEVQVTYED